MDTEQLNSKVKKNFVNNSKTHADIGCYGMSEDELVESLKDFQSACREKDYIEADLFLDEAYPGVIPTSFVVNLWVKKDLLEGMSRGKALDLFSDVLWKTTTPEIRQNIFTLNMLTSGDLTSEQIKMYFYHPINSVRTELINFIKTGALNEQQLHRIFDTNDSNIIKLLSENAKAREVAMSFSKLKYKWAQCNI